GPWRYDGATVPMSAIAPLLPLSGGGVYTSWFQFSKQRGSVLPTHFGERYADDLKRIANLRIFLHANATNLRLSHDGSRLDRFDVATLNGKRFSVQAAAT